LLNVTQCNVLDCISWELLDPDHVELSIQGVLIFGRCHVDTSVRLVTGTTLMLERKGRMEDAKCNRIKDLLVSL